MRYLVIDRDLGRDLVLGAFLAQDDALALALRKMADGYVDTVIIDTVTGLQVFPTSDDGLPASTRLIRNRRGIGEEIGTPLH
jgi:hypothetical protein